MPLKGYLGWYKSTVKGFIPLLKVLLLKGNTVKVRGLETKELSPFIGIFLDPRNRIIDPPGRRLNLAYGIAEALDILVDDNPGIALWFNRNLRNWLNDEGCFDGHYGVRMAAGRGSSIPGVPLQLYRCYKALKKDIYTRQATVTIHNPLLENYDGKDIACTMDLQFLYRDNTLNLIVHMRSNDVLWGFCYDTWFFQFLLESMASWLQLEVGSYTHIVGSLHYYKDKENFIIKIINKSKNHKENYKVIPIDNISIDTWGKIIVNLHKTIKKTIEGDVTGLEALKRFQEMPQPFSSYGLIMLIEYGRRVKDLNLSYRCIDFLPEGSDLELWAKRRLRIES